MTSKRKEKSSRDTYCRISEWLENEDDAFHTVVRGVCLDGRLNASRGAGTTFLCPSESVRKDLIREFSSNPADVEDKIKGHIVKKCLKTASDFGKGPVTTMLGTALEAKSASGGAVTLSNGAQLRLADNFKPLGGRELSVWVVESGEVPTDGARKAEKKLGSGRRRRRGGALGGGAEASVARPTVRLDRARKLAKMFSEWMSSDASRHSSPDPYLVASASMLRQLERHHNTVWKAVLPLIDRDPFVCFHLLVEPYKAPGGDCLLPDSFFDPSADGSWPGAEVDLTGGDASRAFQENFDALSAQTDKSAFVGDTRIVPLLYSAPSAVNEAIDEVRVSLVGDEGEKAGLKTATKLLEAYKNLVNNNTISGQTGILPRSWESLEGREPAPAERATLELLTPDKKLWQDEFRASATAHLAPIRAQAWNAEAFSELIRFTEAWKGNDYVGERDFTNPGKYTGGQIVVGGAIEGLKMFINSTHFMYMATPSAVVGSADYWGGIPTSDKLSRESYERSVFNAEGGKQRYLGAMEGRQTDALANAVLTINAYVEETGMNPKGLRLAAGSSSAAE